MAPDLDPETTIHKLGRWLGELLAGMVIGVILMVAGYALYRAILAIAP